MTNPGSNSLEFKLVFSSDPTRAASAMRQLSNEAKTLDRSAKEAQQSMSRLGHAERAMGGRAGFGQAGVYGMADARGQSQSQAYYGSAGAPRTSAVPPPLPPRSGSSYQQNLPGGGGMGGAAGSASMMAMLGPIGMMAGAVTLVINRLGAFATALDRSAVAVDAGGTRIGRSGRTDFADLASSMPLSGTIGNVMEWTADGAPMGGGPQGMAIRAITGARRGDREKAAIDADNARRRLSAVGPNSERDKGITDLNRRYDDSLNAEYVARGMAGEERASMAGNLKEFRRSPQDFVAMQGAREAERRAFWERDGAQSRDTNASRAVSEARGRVLGAGMQLAQARANVDKNDTIGAPFSPAMANWARERGDVVMAREKQLAIELANLKDAQNRKVESGVALAQKELDLKQKELNLAKTRAEVQVNRQDSAAGEFGLKTASEQLDVINLLQKLESQGIGALSLNERQAGLSSSFSAEKIRLAMEREQANNPLFKRANQLAGMNDYAANKAVQESHITGDFKVTAQVDETLFRESARKAIGGMMDDMVKVLREEAQGKLRQIELEQGKVRAAQSN